ncbi:MAG: mechanosensitive ion channel domain-containing protein [Natronomonas sp.]
MFLVADPDVNVGDLIEWPGGEGTIEVVDFRVTRVRTRDNETISIPLNSQTMPLPVPTAGTDIESQSRYTSPITRTPSEL